MKTVRAGIARAVVAAALVGAGMVVSTAAALPAGAESMTFSCSGVPGKAYVAPPEGWATECQMVNDATTTAPGYDRSTFVVNPGVGHFLSRGQLLDAAATYTAEGISRQFLWYAPMGTVQPPKSTYWSDCATLLRKTENGASVCKYVRTSNLKPIGEDLSTTTLHVIKYHHNWVALACGNFNVPLPLTGGHVPAPVPVIDGIKFNDANRDGVQDNGETGVGGVTFTLTRISSQVGQSPGKVAQTTSAPDGTFSFPLDQTEGPGTYRVQEQTPAGWVNTTPVYETVTVDEGVGNRSYHVAFGDIQELPLSVQGNAISAVEGHPFSGSVATFTDPDSLDSADSPSSATATVSWGDGTTSLGTITSDGGGTYTVSGTHTYVDESAPTVTVNVSDPDDPGAPTTATASATVADANLSNVTGMAIGATEGKVVNPVTVATFSDTNPGATTADFTSGGGSTTIDWGDGTSSTGTVTQTGPGQFSVSGTHTYADEGSYTTTVTIVDDGGSEATVTGSAEVGDAKLTAVGVKPFVSPNPVSRSLATFSDTNPGATTADFTSGGGSTTIDWGDGTSSAGTVKQIGPGQFSVSGIHTYAALGPYKITIHIVDDGGSVATPTTSVIVYGVPAGGDFVIGNENAALGTQVTYWGSQWWKQNGLTGGSAPAAFKGFVSDPTFSTNLIGWTTNPGNSSHPPASVPSYMAIIVSSSITQSGSTIAGNAPEIVIVRTTPGYENDPGHAGTGTVVARLR